MTWFTTFREDVTAARQRDPAAKSAAEVALTYPGLHAVWAYRGHHRLWSTGHRLAARIASQLARFLTGIEIHPGATIGRRCFIDHGSGVVIGATAVVGDDVTMYHGVTLGGTVWREVKRHPTVGDRVIIGAGATLLGDITIGSDSVVAAGAVVLHDAPSHVLVVGVPAVNRPRSSTDASEHNCVICAAEPRAARAGAPSTQHSGRPARRIGRPGSAPAGRGSASAGRELRRQAGGRVGRLGTARAGWELARAGRGSAPAGR